MNKIIIKVSIFFIVLLGVALMGRFLPTMLSEQTIATAGTIAIKELNKIKSDKYEADVIIKKKGKEASLNGTERESLDFYIIDVQKSTLSKIQPTTSFTGKYIFSYKGEGTLVVFRNMNVGQTSFDTKAVQPFKEKKEIEPDYLMTKKVKGVEFTLVYNQLVEKKKTTLTLHINEGNHNVVGKKIYVVDSDVSTFQMFDKQMKKGKVEIDVMFDHDGVYVVFFVVEIDGKAQTIPFKINVNKELK